LREIRNHTVDQIKKSIEDNGFDEARVLLVVPKNDKYVVAGGNHRLQALRELEIKKVPCLIVKNGDLYKLAIQDNEAEKTFAPIDLFDYLDMIKQLKKEGLTQQEIGDKLGWTTSKVKQYSATLSKIVTQVLEFCKQHQKGRVTEKVTNVTFDFTEGWFRNSGLYDLNKEYQMRVIQEVDNFKTINQYTPKYKKWQEWIEICEEELDQEEDVEKMIDLIENNIFKNTKQIDNKISDFNRNSKNKLRNNDAIIELEEIEDSLIDIVITDPPYGIDYISHRSIKKNHITKQGMIGDDKDNSLETLDKICEILKRKTKSEAHIYIFCNWKVYSNFEKVISKYFNIKSVIVWDKGVGGAGDLDHWGDQHEFIIYAIKGNRKLVKRKDNLLKVSRLSSLSKEMIHPTQKPVDLILKLLEASAIPNDIICDPFMGSGSTIKACIKFGNLNYIGIEIDKNMFEKAKLFIG